MTRPRTLTALLLATAASGAVAIPLIALAQPGGGDLPDLVSDPVERPITGIHSDGRLLLRFDGFVTNRRGAGALEIRAGDPDGDAPDPHTMRSVAQWTGPGAPGGARPVTPPGGRTPRVVFETGDGHEHYHLKDAAEYTLWTPDRAAQVALAQKTQAGFCLEDSRRIPGTPGDPRYSAGTNDFCRTVPLVMGISPGWRDLYHRDLAFQWIDVSSTPPGRYELGTRMDPTDVVAESDESNPVTFRAVVVPGYRALPLDLGVPTPGAPVTVRLAADRFAGEGDPHQPGPVRFRIESVPAAGTLTQGARTLRAGDVLTDPAVTYTPSGLAADGFRYSAFDPSRPGYPRDPATGAPAHPAAAATTRVPSVTISGAPASVTAGLAVQLQATVGGVGGGVRWSATAGRVEPDGLFVAPAAPPAGDGVVTVTATSETRPDIAAQARIRVVRAPARVAAATALCAPVPRRASARTGDRVTLSRGALLVTQRISQAAIRRAAGMERWLDAGIAARDICGGSIGVTALGPGLVAASATGTPAPRAADPRPVRIPAAGGGRPDRVALTAAQLLINQRIAQAAIRRVEALERRLDAGLTGGDLRPGAVGRDQLAGSLRIVRATAAPVPPRSRGTARATARRGGTVTLTARQLLINQRIAQAAVRRANALHDRLRRGIAGADLRPGTVVAANLAREVRP